MSEQLAVLFPDKIIKTAQGSVTVRPFPFNNWAKAVSIVSKYITKFRGFDDVSIENTVVEHLPQMMLEAGDDLVSLILLSVDRDQAFIDGLSGEDGFALLQEVIEVNGDFFLQKILPMARNLAARMARKSGTGDASSPS
jgi:hypothetical protein